MTAETAKWTSTHSGVQNGFEPGHTVVVAVGAADVAVVDSVEGRAFGLPSSEVHAATPMTSASAHRFTEYTRSAVPAARGELEADTGPTPFTHRA